MIFMGDTVIESETDNANELSCLSKPAHKWPQELDDLHSLPLFCKR